MHLKQVIRRLIKPNTYSSQAYISFLKRQGCRIGNGCFIFDPKNTFIDYTRPHMLEIGDLVAITSGVKILCHDYSRIVLINAGYGNIGEGKKTIVGNNVFIGMNSVILMGCRIGDNCIIGAGSVISKDIPSNTVWGGNPAKMICTIDKLACKRKDEEIRSAKLFANEFFNSQGRYPTTNEMTNAFSWLYLKRDEDSVRENKELFALNCLNYDVFMKAFYDSAPVWSSYDEFIEECKLEYRNK